MQLYFYQTLCILLFIATSTAPNQVALIKWNYPQHYPPQSGKPIILLPWTSLHLAFPQSLIFRCALFLWQCQMHYDWKIVSKVQMDNPFSQTDIPCCWLSKTVFLTCCKSAQRKEEIGCRLLVFVSFHKVWLE